MLEGIHFSYNGVHSVDMGLLNVKLDGGMFEETFLPSRNIKEIQISGNNKPYYQGIDLEPLEFDLSFAFEYSYDERKIREVARWLMQDYYKPFYTVDNPSRVFYCMLDGDSRLIHNGLKQGYITLTMRCDSPYSYTPQFNKDNLIFTNTKIVNSLTEDIFNNTMGTMSNVKINSQGDLEVDKANVNWSMLVGMKWSDL